MTSLDGAINSPLERLYDSPPNIGIVIGTYGAIPYIHLQLEARKRFYPDLPCLVHDDLSKDFLALGKLCDSYGAEFVTTPKSLGHVWGDTACFIQGLLWAEKRGVELLVKISRRMIPLNSFVEPLTDLALRSQHATFSNHSVTWGFGFRTEFQGMHVRSYLNERLLQDYRNRVNVGNMHCGLPEAYWHQVWAAGVCPESGKAWEDANPSPHGAYAAFDWMGTDRAQRNENFLWHNANSPKEYHDLATSWGLSYALKEFHL